MSGVHPGFHVPLLDPDFDGEPPIGLLESLIERDGYLTPDASLWPDHDFTYFVVRDNPEKKARRQELVKQWREEYSVKRVAERLKRSRREREQRVIERQLKLRELLKAFQRYSSLVAAFRDDPDPKSQIGVSLYNRTHRILMRFPHVDRPIADLVAREFLQVGVGDAPNRRISWGTWLWKRSRFVAGFR